VTPDRPDALEPLPPFASKLLDEHRRLLELDLAGSLSLPLARGYNPHNWSDWIPVFQYRFSNPTARTGAGANYAGRLRGSDGALLSSGVIVYTSQWHPPEASKAVAYHLIE
jgi:hypothetical protein